MHPSPSPSLLCASPASHPGIDPSTRLLANASRPLFLGPLARLARPCCPLPAALIRCLWELPELLAAVALHCCPLLLPALLKILRLHASFAVLHTCYHCMPARPSHRRSPTASATALFIFASTDPSLLCVSPLCDRPRPCARPFQRCAHTAHTNTVSHNLRRPPSLEVRGGHSRCSHARATTHLELGGHPHLTQISRLCARAAIDVSADRRRRRRRRLKGLRTRGLEGSRARGCSDEPVMPHGSRRQSSGAEAAEARGTRPAEARCQGRAIEKGPGSEAESETEAQAAARLLCPQ